MHIFVNFHCIDTEPTNGSASFRELPTVHPGQSLVRRDLQNFGVIYSRV